MNENILIEFFDNEQMENVYACLNYQFDKVYFFGQQKKMIKDKMDGIRYVLNDLCHINNVSFKAVNETNFEKVVDSIESVLTKEKDNGNTCFFDLTGGQDLVLAAMGTLAERHSVPMFQYQILTKKLIEIGDIKLSSVAKKRAIKLNIAQYIKLYGGVINFADQKDNRNNLNNLEFKSDVRKMYDISKPNPKKWNKMSEIFKKMSSSFVSTTKILIHDEELKNIIKGYNELNTLETFENYIAEYEKEGLISYKKSGHKVEIEFKSEIIKETILDAGCMLELDTYFKRKESNQYDDCRVGVHIDWDGVIHTEVATPDVENEIDVIVIKDNIPTVISCKNNNINQKVFYEIDTVANKFSKKYVKKEVVTTCSVSEAYKLRAKDMNISIK